MLWTEDDYRGGPEKSFEILNPPIIFGLEDISVWSMTLILRLDLETQHKAVASEDTVTAVPLNSDPMGKRLTVP